MSCMLANHDTALSSFAVCASWSHTLGSMGSVVAGSALRIRCHTALAHRLGWVGFVPFPVVVVFAQQT